MSTRAERGGGSASHLVGLSVFAVLIAAFLAVESAGDFLSLDNVQSMATQLPEFGLLALAVLPTLLTGGIDLSVVATANLAGITAALLMTQHGASGWIALPAALLSGAACGLVNGLLVAFCRLPAILATLGTLQLISGAAVVLTKGHAVIGLPDWLSDLGDMTLFDTVPLTLAVFFVFAALLGAILRFTRYGLELRLYGINPVAARFAGLRIRSVLLRTYLMAGVISAVAGIVVLARVNSANADYGSSYLLFVILINILAGVDPRGGFGSVAGVVLAVVTLQLLASGLDFLSLNNFARDLLFGGLLLLVMAVRALAGMRPGFLKRSAR